MLSSTQRPFTCLRERIVEKTEAPECIGCHQLMNPLGYPFEIYNHAGFLRESDHGAAPQRAGHSGLNAGARIGRGGVRCDRADDALGRLATRKTLFYTTDISILHGSR